MIFKKQSEKLKHYEGEHCNNWRRTDGHDRTGSECFPSRWPEINKDHIPISGVVYKFSCGGCNATYIGKTKRHLKKRVSKRIGVFALTGKVLKQQHAVRDHMLDCDRVVKHDDFVLMTGDNSDYLLQIKESLFLNKMFMSLKYVTIFCHYIMDMSLVIYLYTYNILYILYTPWNRFGYRIGQLVHLRFHAY